MELKYRLEDTPGWKENLLYGLQWLVISLPGLIIIGKLLGSMNGSLVMEVIYLQKVFVLTGVAMLIQIFWGHRLPLVIGPVNFSFSPGIIAATGCAARRSLIPAAMVLILLAFLPRVIFYLSHIPSVVVGTLLLYIMCTQVAAGLTEAFGALSNMGEPNFDNTLVISMPILASIIVAFLPKSVTASFPIFLQPVLSNGFVVGIVLALLLEHVIFRKWV